MDAKGPGVITRWWMPQEQLLNYRIVRIYLDDKPEPMIEENYQDLISGQSFITSPFAFTSSDEKDSAFQYNLPVGHPKQMGAGMYFPIPFSRSCKITLDITPFYYSINYRQYQEGTMIESFSKEVYNAHKRLRDSIGLILLGKNTRSARYIQKSEQVLPDQVLEMDLPSGAGHAIDEIRLNIESKEKKRVNRGVVLQINFDHTETVWCPVSEFFAGGVYARQVKNFKTDVSKQGDMTVRWLMPYQKNATLTLKNTTPETIKASLNVSVIPYEWNKHSLYFHTDWHEEAPLNTSPSKDWNYIEINGTGLYVGDVLTVHSLSKSWWGEGDEKIYFNGEKFPSMLGTGLEDYYGYAWGLANYFSSPFISMPERDARGKDDWRGYNTVSRIRLLDAIPFEKKLKVDMEAWQVDSGVSYAVATFWYGLPGAKVNIEPNEKTVQRALADFNPEKKVKGPGTVYPDPAEGKIINPKGNGTIRYAGNHLDLLEWKNKAINKPLDADHDQQYGTEGFYIIGLQRFSVKEMAFKKDSLRSLPDFIESIDVKKIAPNPNNKNTWLFIPEDTAVAYITGKSEVSNHEAESGLLTLHFNQKAPSSVRLGILLDNADEFNKVGKSIRVTNSTGGNSGEVPLAISNRVPDWYFFDIAIKPGDKIIVSGKTMKESDLFTLGGLTFDLKKE